MVEFREGDMLVEQHQTSHLPPSLRWIQHCQCLFENVKYCRNALKFRTYQEEEEEEEVFVYNFKHHRDFSDE